MAIFRCSACYFLAMVTILAMAPRLSVSCNVETNPELIDSIVSANSLADVANQLEIIPPARLSNGRVRVVEVDADGAGGVAGTFWFLEKLRMTDGFIATFRFQVSGSSDGFALVVQNDRIEDIEGGVGDNLGFKNGINSYVAVLFDICSDRVANPGACSTEKISIVSREGGNNPSVVDETASFETIKGSGIHTARISYADNIRTLKVTLDNTDVLTTQLPQPMGDIIGNKFGFLGFAASNTVLPANIEILDLDLGVRLSNSKVVEGIRGKDPVDFNRAFQVKLSIRDLCNNQVDNAAVVSQNIDTSSIEAFLSLEGGDKIVEPFEIRNNNDGTFTVVFSMPAITGSWTLNSAVNGEATQGTPLKGAFTSGNLDTGGISQESLILIGVLIGVLVLATIYIARRTRRFRAKLIENDEDIKYGHEVVKVAEIEKVIKYNANPLAVKSMDELRQQLSENKKELDRLMKRRGGDDDQFTIQQLQEQNRKLMKQLGKLKRQEQQLEVDNQIGRGKKVGIRKKNRKEFEQESVKSVSTRNPIFDVDY